MKHAYLLILPALLLTGCNFLRPTEPDVPTPAPEFSLQCQTDTDCKSLISTNSCQVFCTNTTAVNQAIVDGLPATCNAETWDPTAINCLCLENTCTAQAQ